MPFILNEDEALKNILKGMTVADSGKSNRPVAVYYGQPDKDITAQIYPYVTVDLIGIKEDTSRAHRGYVPLTYLPEGVDSTIDYNLNFPVPVDLLYQISTWSRQPRHDRQIVAQLFSQRRLPFRFGQLAIDADGTNRRLDMLGFSKRDTTESGKRLFSNSYTIRISAEIFPDLLVQMYKVLETPTISFDQVINKPVTIPN